MDFIRKLWAEIEQLKSAINLLRRGLVRVGTVDSVNATLGTVVVAFVGEAADGGALKSPPIPWLQRSTEHRPPAAGDHAIVIDPSLGMGGALAITGWVSLTKPAAGAGGSAHVLYAGTDQCKVIATDIRLGVLPADFAALASLVLAELQAVQADFAAFKTTFDTHVHTSACTAGGATTAPTATPAPTAHTPASVAASQVRVQ